MAPATVLTVLTALTRHNWASATLSLDAVVVDGRTAEAFDAGLLPGAVNIPPGGEDAGTVAAALLHRDVPAIALGETPERAEQTADRLAGAGFRHVLGAVGGRDAERLLAGRPLRRSGAVDVARVAGELATGAVLLVDVRDDREWACGRVHGSALLPLESLRTSGMRAAAAASALRRLGHDNVWRLAGGGVPDLLARPLGLDLLGAA